MSIRYKQRAVRKNFNICANEHYKAKFLKKSKKALDFLTLSILVTRTCVVSEILTKVWRSLDLINKIILIENFHEVLNAYSYIEKILIRIIQLFFG